jgi:hypothetical protein
VPVESYVEQVLTVKQGEVTLHEQKVRVTKANIGELSSLRTDSSEWAAKPKTREDIEFSVDYRRYYEWEHGKGAHIVLGDTTLIPIDKLSPAR